MPLSLIIEHTKEVALARGHGAEYLWLTYQTISWPGGRGAPPPPELFPEWDRVRGMLDPDDTQSEQVRATIQKEFFDSRTTPHDKSKVFDKPLTYIEEVLDKCDMYESNAEGRSADPRLVEMCDDCSTRRSPDLHG